MHRQARGAQKPSRAPSAAWIAVAATMLWHGALVGWLSTLGMRARDVPDAARAADAIDVVFVFRREAAPLRLDRSYPSIPRRQPAAARTTHASAPDPTEREPALDPLPEAAADRTAVVTGDDRWSPSPAAAVPHVVVPPRNPLARVDRHALDVAPRLRVRVRMRPPRSVEAWLNVLAPAGYEADPCPEITRAIAGLASDGAAHSRTLLDDAVDFEARYCR